MIYAFKLDEDSEQKIKYVGETKVRFETRTYEHCNTDKASSVYKFKQSNTVGVEQSDFVILEKGFKDLWDRKLAEALYIRDFQPVLNEQVVCHKLKLFN